MDSAGFKFAKPVHRKRKKTPEQRLMEKIVVNQNTGCWEYTGQCNNRGYGQLSVDRRMLSAHRFSWITHRNAIPAGICVLHKCDNRKCCNPGHLFLGTAKDNSRDMVAKGRLKSIPPKLCGEQCGSAKLTNEQVKFIRDHYHRYGRGIGAILSRQFGVAPATISRVIRNESWSHVSQAKR